MSCPTWCWELNSVPLEKQHVLLTAESALRIWTGGEQRGKDGERGRKRAKGCHLCRDLEKRQGEI